MNQQEKERELKNLMILEKHIEEGIKDMKMRLDTTKICLDIFALAQKKCVTSQWDLKEKLRVR